MSVARRINFHAVLFTALVLVITASTGRIPAASRATASPPPSGPNKTVATTLFGRPAHVQATDTGTGLPSNFRDERVAGGSDLPYQFQLNNPTAMAFLPDGRILVTEKAGKLRLVKDSLVQPTPALDWSAQVYPYGDAGLIDVAVDPAFASNGYIYLAYTSDNPREGRVSRFTMSGDTVDPNSEVVLLSTIADHDTHMIDSVQFGQDGLLYASDGDSAPFDTATVYSTRAQQPDQTVGKLYRMTSSGQGLSSNPFWTGNANDAASKVFGLGLRNPFRFTTQPDGSVIVGDVGWNTWEELNRISPGTGNHNYGWPCYEGGPTGSLVQPAFSGFPVCQALVPQGTGAVTAPVYAYDHSAGSSAVVGGPVYDGTAFPAPYPGSYFFGDYSAGWLDYWPMDSSGNFVGQPVRFASVANPVDIVTGPDGDLYYVSITKNQIRRIAYGAATSCAPGNYLAQYYTNQTWSGAPAVVRCEDTVNYDWGQNSPIPGTIPIDHFSVSWSGSQYFTKGQSTITSTSDDGMQVWVDGQLTVDNSGDHSATTKSATVNYPTGAFHDILIKYYDDTNLAVAKVSIVSANKPPVPVISSPVLGARFSSGQQLALAGSASDPEDGILAGSSLHWNVILHHCPPEPAGATEVCHTHPYDSFSGATGTVIAPDTSGDWVWLEIQLTATDSSGATATARATAFPNLCANEAALAHYYTNQTWSGTPAITRCDASINFDWGYGGPFGASPTDNFSVEWHSARYFAAGSSFVSSTSDDGTQVWVDGQLVVDNNGVHPVTTKVGTVAFPVARYHDVFVRYYEAGGQAVAKVSTPTPNGCTSTQLRGHYFTNQTWSGTPTINRCDSAINFNWGSGGPFGSSPVDHFSVEWQSPYALRAGTSTLTSASDDGMQVWVDGLLIVDNNGIHPATTKTGTVTFSVAGYHNLVVRYYENTGLASAQLNIS